MARAGGACLAEVAAPQAGSSALPTKVDFFEDEDGDEKGWDVERAERGKGQKGETSNIEYPPFEDEGQDVEDWALIVVLKWLSGMGRPNSNPPDLLTRANV